MDPKLVLLIGFSAYITFGWICYVIYLRGIGKDIEKVDDDEAFFIIFCWPFAITWFLCYLANEAAKSAAKKDFTALSVRKGKREGDLPIPHEQQGGQA